MRYLVPLPICLLLVLLARPTEQLASPQRLALLNSWAARTPAQCSRHGTVSRARTISVQLADDEVESEGLVLTCGTCKASYEITQADIGDGRRVKCANCGHAWYQTSMRLSPLPGAMELVDYPAEMKKRLDAGLPVEIIAGFRAYVGNLPFGTSEEELRDLFEPYGTIVGVDILVDETGRPRGFGFVNLEKASDGNAAVEALNGYKLNGRALTVSEGKTPAGRGGRGGRGRGGGRGDFRGRGGRGRGDGRGRGRDRD